MASKTVTRPPNLDPIPALLDWPDKALTYYLHRDLEGKPVGPIETLWELPAAARLVRKQPGDGSWKYPGKTCDPDSGTNYSLVATYRNLRVLVEICGYSRQNPALERAAEYIFSCQRPGLVRLQPGSGSAVADRLWQRGEG
jgi:hypothetical protein